MLQVEGITARYGHVTAIDEVSLYVNKGECVAIVGPNGAGKTTLFKTISGIVKLAAGRVVYEGHDLVSLDPADRPALGIAHVPEGRQVFRELTVEENLELGTTALADQKRKTNLFDDVYSLFPVLAERRYQFAGTLSGGEQQMLSIGRGLVMNPKLMLLDEPSLGLAPVFVDKIFDAITQLRRDYKLTVLLVEQRARETLELCDRAYVLSVGRLVAEGKPSDLIASGMISRAYFGAREDPHRADHDAGPNYPEK